ncbi:MAG: hypothetical protein J6B95_01880 [Oscillospiraceae bacterium]|nr:hypothetical protein [Oscillospiraceae bacterium]
MTNKRRTSVLVLAMLLCVALMLSACGGEKPESGVSVGSGEANYQVKVADALGNPYTEGVIVRFMSNGQQAAMQVVDANGVAAKVMAKGDYQVELMFTDTEGSYYYDAADLNLSASKTELEVVLSYTPAAEASTLVVRDESYNAYRVSTGCTRVDLEAGKMNYFLFTPSIAGTYEFSVIEDAGQIGYYGAPHFVQENNLAEVTDNAFTVSISASMIGTGDSGTTTLVIGIEAADADGCTLAIERIGEAERTLADEPWMIYETTAELAPYTLPAGASLKEFDLTAETGKYNLVLNEKDGFYHLDSADGPLVLVNLGKDGNYLDSFKTILDNSGVSKYFYDENGEFVKKESYTECLLEYIACMDESNGVYPLTEDLKYIIQQRGDHSEWFDSSSSSYLFVDENGNMVPGINSEIAWLFMCCYIAG